MSSKTSFPECDVLLIVATDVEVKTLLDMAEERTSLRAKEVFREERSYFDLGSLGGAHVMMVRSEMGSATIGGALPTALIAIRELRPAAVVMLGIAFGVDPEKQSIGQVLVSRQIQAYEFQRVGDSIGLRGDRATASPKLLNLFRTAVHAWRYTSDAVKFGLLLSGEKLIDSLDYRDSLLGLLPEAIGGEMEGAGMYAAARERETPWIVVKAICDWADGNKIKNKHEHQRLAAERAVDLVLHTLSQGGFSTQLRTPSRFISGSRCMARQPDYFVATEAVKEAKSILIKFDEARETKRVLALCGPGGFGKTIAASALSFDRDIRELYHAGILWLKLGLRLSDSNRLLRIKDVISYWTSETSPGFETAYAAATFLRDLLADKRVLLVVDDVWTPADFEIVDLLSSSVAILTTTRQRTQLSTGYSVVEISPMTSREAISMLGIGIRAPNTEPITPLIELTAGWPILLRLVNTQLRRWTTFGLELKDSVCRVLSALSEQGLEAFDNKDSHKREEAIKLTVNASLDGLVGAERRRYSDLGIFPEAEDLPVKVLAALWGLSLHETEVFCGKLYDMSLLSQIDLNTGIVRVHDILLRFLKGAAQDELPRRHCALLDLLTPESGLWSDLGPEDTYLWRNLAYHYQAGERGSQFRALLFDLQFLQSKLNLLGLPPILEDCANYTKDNQVKALRNALRLSAHSLRDYPVQLPAQLIARLSFSSGSAIRHLLADCARQPGILPQRAPLATIKGKLRRAFNGYENPVTAATILGDGSVVAGHSDAVISIMNPQTGLIRGELSGHHDRINKLELVEGEVFASASDDSNINLWDGVTLECVKTLSGHTDKAQDVAVLDGSRLISVSFDKTIRVWRIQTGKTEAVISGPTGFTRVLGINDDTLITCSLDGFVRAWSLKEERCFAELRGHALPGFALRSLGTHRVVTTSQDNRILIWDTEDLKVVDSYALSNEIGIGITAMTTLRSKYIAFSTWGGTISLWDVESGNIVTEDRADTGWPQMLIESSDGLLISFSSENIVYFWNIDTFLEHGAEEPVRHEQWVSGLAFVGERHFVSSSWDSSIFLWNSDPAVFANILGAHEGRANDLLSFGNNLILSTGEDGMIRLWDIQQSVALGSVKISPNSIFSLRYISPQSVVFLTGTPCVLGHWNMATGAVRFFQETVPLWTEIACLTDSTVAAISFNDGIIIFDLDTWSITGSLVGPVNYMAAIAKVDDKRLAIVDPENAIVILDIETAEVKQRLCGHTDTVVAMESLSNNYLISVSSDRNLFLWDTLRGYVLFSFTLDSKPSSLCVSPSQGQVLVGTEEGDVNLFIINDLPPETLAWDPRAHTSPRPDRDGGACLEWRFVRRVGKNRVSSDFHEIAAHRCLDKLLKQVVAGCWDHTENSEVEQLRLDLEARDRVVLVDVLLLACLVRWDGATFDFILDLAEDDNPIVEAEAALALCVLLGLTSTVENLEDLTNLRRRTLGRLESLEFLEKLLWAKQARFTRQRGSQDVDESAWPPSPQLLPHTLWLRPIDIGDDFTSTDFMAAPFSFLRELSADLSHSPAVKRMIGGSVSELSREQRRALFTAINNFATRCKNLNALLSFFLERWEALEFFVRKKMSGELKENILAKITSQERSIAEFITVSPYRELLIAREALKDAREAYRAEDRKLGDEFTQVARENYEKVPNDFDLDYQEWYFKAVELDRQADNSLGDPAREETLRLQAIEIYDKAIAIWKDEPATLHRIAWDFVRVADLNKEMVSFERERGFREQAINKFEDALLADGDRLSVLKSLSVQLLRSCSYSKIGSAARKRNMDRTEEVLQQLAELEGTDLHQNYNYACLLALRGDVDEALVSLRACLEVENISSSHVRGDSDWEALRSDRRLQELLEHYDD